MSVSGKPCFSISPNRPRHGLLVVVSGPSGVGKSSVVEGMAERRSFHFSVSGTTRTPRPGEIDGEDYHFFDRDEFETKVANGDFLEWAEYSGNLYGTLKTHVLDQLEIGSDVLLDIENDGAGQIKRSYPHAVLIFLMPPSIEELERRLRGRGDTPTEEVQRRLALAGEQIADAQQNFDHLVVNDDLRIAIDEVVSILDRYRNPES